VCARAHVRTHAHKSKPRRFKKLLTHCKFSDEHKKFMQVYDAHSNYELFSQIELDIM
jgi:hypothetical protein